MAGLSGAAGWGLVGENGPTTTGQVKNDRKEIEAFMSQH
jgi:hypothetical protein